MIFGLQILTSTDCLKTYFLNPYLVSKSILFLSTFLLDYSTHFQMRCRVAAISVQFTVLLIVTAAAPVIDEYSILNLPTGKEAGLGI